MQIPEKHAVNIELGNDFSTVFYEASALTWEIRRGRFGEVDEGFAAFSGFRGLPLKYLHSTEGLILSGGTDGVGTKIEIAERLRSHWGVPMDLFAMACDDQARWGAETICVMSVLDTRKLDDNPRTRQAIAELAEGTVEAARQADVIVLTGETAELGDRVSGYRVEDTDLNYNWGLAVVSLVHESRRITGHNIEPGHSLVGLTEQGFRSNGISKVREILGEKVGPDWHEQVVDSSGVTFGELVQTPSIIYSKFINKLTGGFDIRNPVLAQISGIAHITQGGIPEKLKRMLEPSSYGAVIDSLMQPPEIMSLVQRLGEVPDKDAYGYWHMGPGMIIATPEPEKVLEIAAIEGLSAKQIGAVVQSPIISIKSQGAMHPDRWINFFI